MWTSENRGRYDRSKLRYPSDLTDEEWALVAPLIPAAKRGGNKRTVNLREVANGLMYILSTGCQWAAIPKDLPPRSTLHDYFDRWDDDGTLGRIHHALYQPVDEVLNWPFTHNMSRPKLRMTTLCSGLIAEQRLRQRAAMWHAGSWRGETPARALRSSIARASRAQKKGAPH